MDENKVYKNWDGHYIGDPATFKAVAFAVHLIDEGKLMKDALGIASTYHKVPVSAVALELMVDRFIRANSQ